MIFFCFFKQKTAYEMRISDWSSDVCSSDLDTGRRAALDRRLVRPGASGQERRPGQARQPQCADARPWHLAARPGAGGAFLPGRGVAGRRRNSRRDGARSEEHTSELQSLMRISYAVFCLQKKKKTNDMRKKEIKNTLTNIQNKTRECNNKQSNNIANKKNDIPQSHQYQ